MLSRGAVPWHMVGSIRSVNLAKLTNGRGREVKAAGCHWVGWGLSMPTKGAPEDTPPEGGEGPVPCPGRTEPFIPQASGGHSHLFPSQLLGQVALGNHPPAAAPHVGRLPARVLRKGAWPPPLLLGQNVGRLQMTWPPGPPPLCPGLAAPGWDGWESQVSPSPAGAICSIASLCNVSLRGCGPREQLRSSSGD